MKKKYIGQLGALCSLFVCVAGLAPHSAWAVNITVTKGWPCNVFLQQPGVDDAPGNFADFNVKASPSAPTSTLAFVVGENANYLSSIGLDLNRLVSDLPLLEPLGFYFKSERFGAKFGVDICIPPLNETREDVISWTASVMGLGPLLPPADGDWFSLTSPKVSLELLASNCNGSVGSAMSTSAPQLAGKCEMTSNPLPGADVLSASGIPLNFAFQLVASRQAVLRLTIEEQSTAPRPHAWNAGQIQVEFTDPPLPPLLVGDLLGKQLFFAPETDLGAWPGCTNFSLPTGIAMSELNLQGPNTSLELRWTGKDGDCPTSGTCANGNKRANNFSFPVTVYLENGSIAPPTASPSDKVKSFEALFSDQVASGEVAYPSDAKINFDALLDEVYRHSGKAFFSTTVSRLVGPGQWNQCRVWFKRDNGFDCTTLPTVQLQTLCQNMT